MIRIRITREQLVGARVLPAGETIEATRQRAARLIARGDAEAVPDAAPDPPKPSRKPSPTDRS